MDIFNIGSKKFKDVKFFKLNNHSDKRGYFKEVYNNEIEKFIDLGVQFIQDNESFSEYGVLRGLHFQKGPKEQSKLVRVSLGEIQDVVVDIRKDSETYGHWESFNLSSKNNEILYVPKGFAHGFLVLSEYAIVNYKVDNFYSQENEISIPYNYPKLKLDWKLNDSEINISDKDKVITKNFIL